MKKNKNIKIIIVIIIGVILSGITYVAAKTLINSKDVIYTDTYNLGAENVQAAIDGTCSKIDTRLSEIENQLYTVKNISVEKRFTPPTTEAMTYTGLSVTVPANSYCSLSGKAGNYLHVPYRVSLNYNSTSYISTLSFSDYGTQGAASYLSTTYSFYTNGEMTVYLWVKYAYNQNATNQTEQISIDGFCATKYK